MNKSEDELESIEVTHHRIMGEDLIELKKNPAFQRLIMKGYLEQKVLASVSLLGVPQEKDRRGGVLEDLVSASNLQYFFTMVEGFYAGCTNPILSDEEEAAINAEESEHGVN